SQLPGNPPSLLASASVCVELGYALQCKRSEQIILARQDREDFTGHFPFEVPSQQQIVFHNATDLSAQLKTLIEAQLKRYGLV
ncbi:MAG: hypothetical protein F6K42_32135, partial [Leptolyngbya sp. SIO1D8]|nr:hypothetical protein [Leptolyngbya sp. SIO1D8]